MFESEMFVIRDGFNFAIMRNQNFKQMLENSISNFYVKSNKFYDKWLN